MKRATFDLSLIPRKFMYKKSSIINSYQSKVNNFVYFYIEEKSYEKLVILKLAF